jgi:arylformamidase
MDPQVFYRDLNSQALIDEQYNPALKLDDKLAPARHYVRQSQRARSSLHHHVDVPYGPTLQETLDIFPAEQPGAPVFVFLHGGYWRANTSKEFSAVALGLQPLGITTVVVNYALCPFVTLDEIVRQVRAALAWTIQNIETYGGDPKRIAVGGHSAGGQLTAMALQTPWARDYGLDDNPFMAAVLISGIYDIAPLRYSFLQPLIQLDEGIVRRNSPAFMVRPCPTPIWTIWGGAESPEFARQAQLFHDAWTAAGNRGTLQAIEGADHYTVIHGFEQPQGALCQWLAAQLSGPAS